MATSPCLLQYDEEGEEADDEVRLFKAAGCSVVKCMVPVVCSATLKIIFPVYYQAMLVFHRPKLSRHIIFIFLLLLKYHSHIKHCPNGEPTPTWCCLLYFCPHWEWMTGGCISLWAALVVYSACCKSRSVIRATVTEPLLLRIFTVKIKVEDFFFLLQFLISNCKFLF